MRIRITSMATLLALTAAFLATAIPAALAEEPVPVAYCQPGTAGGSTAHVSAWALMTESQFADLLVEEFNAPSQDLADGAAKATFDFCDKNEDRFACVLTKKQTGANFHSGGWLAEDNNYPNS